MRLRFRFTLLATIVALMVTSLGAVSGFVLVRNQESSRAISDLQIHQAAADVQDRITRFLERGPQALSRMRRLVEGGFLDLGDRGRLEAYLITEMRADRELTWLSFSDTAAGAFTGVTRRDGQLILNLSEPAVNGGRPREWEVRDEGTRAPVTARNQDPYDPRPAPWFQLGLKAAQPQWTDLYKFAEGEWGISTVLGLRGRGAGGVATADFHLRVIDDFLAGLRVGAGGRAVVVVPQGAGGRVVLGGRDLPPAMARALAAVTGELGKAGRGGPSEAVRSGDGTVVTSLRSVDPGSGRPWYLAVMEAAGEADAPIRRATRDILLVSAAFLVLGMAVAFWMANAITRPIRSMSEDLRRVGEMRLTSGPPAHSFIHEMDSMARTLAAMKAALRSFSYYVPVELVRALLDSGTEVQPGGETRPLTILFTDIADFTRIAESLPPDELARELGLYFDVVEQAITEAGGLVDKFMGDGAMALFNAPQSSPDHAARACAAALRLQERLKPFNAARAAEGRPCFDTRVGLAVGPAVVGNIGTARRLAYTAIGDVVNLASHLETLNKVYGTTILADGGVRAESGDGFEWRHLDRIAVAGRTAPVELFELLGRTGEVAPARLRTRDLHETALAALTAGNFDRATRGFAALIQADPRDYAAKVLLAYTEETRRAFAEVPSGEWRGVHVYATRKPG